MYSTNEPKLLEMLANIASLAATRSAVAGVSLRVAFSRTSTLVVLLTTLTGLQELNFEILFRARRTSLRGARVSITMEVARSVVDTVRARRTLAISTFRR